MGLISIAIIDMLAKGFGASLFWSVFLAIGLTIASLILAGKFGGRVPLLQKFHDNVIGEKSSGRAFLLTYVVIYVISFCLLFAPLHAYYNVSYYRYNDTFTPTHAIAGMSTKTTVTVAIMKKSANPRFRTTS